MKNLIQIIATIKLLLLLMGCKKEATSDTNSSLKSSLSFNYEGRQYVLIYEGTGIQNWGASDNGILIDRPDIFNGRIDFLRAGCAYLTPINTSIYANRNCELTNSSGLPIDSAVVYTYQRGVINITYSNCQTKWGYDIVTGTNYTYRICDGSGTFDLVLKNKSNQLITITAGIIKIYNQIR